MTTDLDQKTGPELSIGMPVYNGEDFVEEAISSLLAQSFENFELIISDNASTDRTEEIVQRFAQNDARIKYVKQPQNKGAVGNFKFVYEAAQAPYFMWAAGDDVWESDWVETLLPVARSSKCLSYGVCQAIDENGEPLPSFANARTFNYTGSRLRRRMKYYIDPAALGKANPIYGIFEKSMFSPDVWAEFEIKRNAPDVMALYEILKTHEIVHAGNTCLMKRMHQSNTENDETFVKKKPRRSFRMFRHTQVPDYFRSSNTVERILIVVCYPLARLGLTWVKIKRSRAKRAARA